MERHVHRVAPTRAGADLVHEARPREEAVAPLVRRDGEDVGGVVEGELDAVAVVGVDVDVADPEAVRPQGLDRQHRVVEVAEAGGAARHRVVEPAREREGPRHLAARHQLGRPDRAATGERGGLVHPRPDGVVARPEAVPVRVRHLPAGRERAQHVQVLGGVEAAEDGLGGGLRRELSHPGQRGEAVGLHQRAGEPESLHPEWMARPVVEPLVGVGVHQSRFHGRRRLRAHPVPAPAAGLLEEARSVRTSRRSIAFTMS